MLHEMRTPTMHQQNPGLINKLVPRPFPNFKPGSDTRQWLRRLEKFLVLLCVPISQQPWYANQFLKAETLTPWEAIVANLLAQNATVTLNHFRASLVKYNETVLHTQRVQTEVEKLRQTGSVAKCVRNAESCMGYLKPLWHSMPAKLYTTSLRAGGLCWETCGG